MPAPPNIWPSCCQLGIEKSAFLVTFPGTKALKLWVLYFELPPETIRLLIEGYLFNSHINSPISMPSIQTPDTSSRPQFRSWIRVEIKFSIANPVTEIWGSWGCGERPRMIARCILRNTNCQWANLPAENWRATLALNDHDLEVSSPYYLPGG